MIVGGRWALLGRGLLLRHCERLWGDPFRVCLWESSPRLVLGVMEWDSAAGGAWRVVSVSRGGVG